MVAITCAVGVNKGFVIDAAESGTSQAVHALARYNECLEAYVVEACIDAGLHIQCGCMSSSIERPRNPVSQESTWHSRK